MNLKLFTINALKDIIAAAQDEKPYFGGSDLVMLFNQVGVKDLYVYGKGGFTGYGLRPSMSRKEYVLNRLEKLNNSLQLKNFIEGFISGALTQIELDQEIRFIERVNQIIKSDGYKIEKIGENYSIIGHDTYEEPIEATVHFEDIQRQILGEIRKAKFMIWVAMAWFTDNVLFNELVTKSREGLNVQVIISDDEINANSGLRFSDFFETHKRSKWGVYGNIMHNKFCIIDLRTVISGSYNWTKKAQYNSESIEVKNSRELAEQYANEFIKLKSV